MSSPGHSGDALTKPRRDALTSRVKCNCNAKGLGYTKWQAEHGWDESQALNLPAPPGALVHLLVVRHHALAVLTKAASKVVV